jgi:sarcosine oxidase
MAQENYDVIVIGAGLMGSATARYLSGLGLRVAIIGPSEPDGEGAPPSVYASHYDEGRLTWRLGKNVTWSRLAQRAIAQYRQLEKASGIPFYRPVGLLQAQPGGEASAALAIAAEEGLAYSLYPPGDLGWRAHADQLHLPRDCHVLFEPDPAGMINPRAMLRAQLAIAAQQGATLIRETVIRVEETVDEVRVESSSGRLLRAPKTLVAAGAFTNFGKLLPCPIPLRLKTETIILGDVGEASAARMARMPVVTYQIDDREIDDIYMTPPMRYPDGRYCVKLGCNTRVDEWPETLEAVQAWFRHGDSDICKPAMARALQELLPAVEFLSITSARCIVAYTPSGLPTIDGVSERIFVAAGGNGSSAKCADSVGWLAAGLMHDGRWPAEIERKPFQARTR